MLRRGGYFVFCISGMVGFYYLVRWAMHSVGSYFGIVGLVAVIIAVVISALCLLCIGKYIEKKNAIVDLDNSRAAPRHRP